MKDHNIVEVSPEYEANLCRIDQVLAGFSYQNMSDDLSTIEL